MAEGFVPVDLGACRNAGTANRRYVDGTWIWPGPAADPERTALTDLPWGDRSFWGIPFHLGPGAGEHGMVVVAGQAEGLPARITLPLAGRARSLLFAHACAPLADAAPGVDGVGETVGTYRLHFADGTVAELALRRRFEIQDVVIPWGHRPFLCRNCREFRSIPLDDRSLSFGRVQTGIVTEAGHEQQGWWLFSWEVPDPELELASLEVIAAERSAVALAGLTLGAREVDPLVWPPREEVTLTVEGEPSGPVQVEIDRGVVARQDHLFTPTQEWLTTDQTGWGQGGQEVREGRYLEVHGAAEGRLRVRAGQVDEEVRWGDVVANPAVTQGPVRVERIAPRGKQWVHVRIEDADTGRPVGARVHFRTEQGAYLAPHGHQADVNVGWFEDVGGDCKVRGTPYAYLDGTCQIELPVGPVLVELVRGC
ncbi:MAG: hypothetical protein WDA75_15455, partial [Candidatus Latescibacterota bacterium]